MAGIYQGLKAVHTGAPRQDGVVHQQYRIFGDDAHQHDQSNHGRHRQRLAGQQQQNESPAYAQRQRRKNRHRLHEVVEQQDQHAVNTQNANQHGDTEAGKQGLHFLGVAEFGNRHAGRQIFQAGQLP